MRNRKLLNSIIFTAKSYLKKHIDTTFSKTFIIHIWMNTSCITKRPYKSFESTMTGRGLSLYPALCSAANTFVGTPSASLASLNVDQQMPLTNRVQRPYFKLRNDFVSWFGFINRAEKTRFRNLQYGLRKIEFVGCLLLHISWL